jgi:hypothetical protein
MKYLLLAVSLIIVGCGPSHRIILDYNADEFVVTKIKHTQVKLFVDTCVDVLEFKVSFINEYHSKAEFDSIFAFQLMKEWSKSLTVTKVDTNELRVIFSEQSYSDENIKRVKEIFEAASESYFIGIKKVYISNEIKEPAIPIYQAPMIVSTPKCPISYGGGFVGGGGQTEDCVVDIKTEIWSVKDRKKVSEFDAISQYPVTLPFAYGTALKSAVKLVISTLCNYIENNKIK